MGWIEDNKGEGPWSFIPRKNKWGYLNNPRWTRVPVAPVNYDDREDDEPQIWSPEPNGRADGSDEHFPCGHWHKRSIEIPVVPYVPRFEVYFELINGQIAQPHLDEHSDLLSSASFIPINANDFDGEVDWFFEVIGFNDYSFDVTVQAVDTYGNVCASVVMPAGSIGATGSELFRWRENFTPTIFNDVKHYGVKLVLPEGEHISWYPLKCMITVARIIVRQSGATKTKIQVPLYGSIYNYTLQEYNEYPYDTPLGDSIYDAHTPGNESGDIYNNCSVWKFSESELSNISKFIFSPAAENPNKIGGVITKTMYIFASLNFRHFHYMLYSTTSTDSHRSDATPSFWVDEYQSHVDNVSGLTYTPVPDSLCEWDVGVGPYPFSFTRYPDFSGLGSGNHMIAIGGELYIGVPTENKWEHWQTWFTLSIPSGRRVTNAVLTVWSTDQSHMTWKLEYQLEYIDAPDLVLSLYDKTDSKIVPGSELTWEPDGEFSRKFAEIDPDELEEGHEYRLGVNYPSYNLYPEIMDAQLLINIDVIYKLTVWHRCLSRWNGLWDYWDVPDAWGVDYWGDSEGANCISPRAKFFQPDAKFLVFFEATAKGFSPYSPSQRVYLENFGSDGNSGSTGSDVTDGMIYWTENIYNKLLRKRTPTLDLDHDDEYGNRYYDLEYELAIANGFLVIRVI